MISLKKLNDMSDLTLSNIFKSLNYWEWPNELGEKPDSWDELPNYQKPYMDECKTKADIIRPYMYAIKQRISM